MLKSYQNIKKYFKNHPHYSAFVHITAGVGVGIMVTYPFVGPHPVRWAAVFFGLSILGHLYPLVVKK